MRAGERRGERADPRYDTDLIKEEGERLLAAYLGRPGKVSGSRMLWECPKCGKPKLSLQRTKGSVGCLNAGCEVETNTDVIGVVASLEGLQTRGEDFKRVCALSYELLSIPDPASDPGCRTGSPDGRAAPRAAARAPRPRDPEPLVPSGPDVVDAVLSRLLQLCPLEGRDVGFLASRGVAEQTALFGRFGSITGRRARHAMGVLDREFPREQLRGVPGFRERDADGDGRNPQLGFTLWGDFLLIPYFDRTGRVVTLEGRAVGDVPAWAGKYTSLRNGGNHLYVFPAFDADDLVAVCEGPMGAIVAAQEGLAVGAIQGVKRYTKAKAQAGAAPGQEEPLPELAHADFGGRVVLYVPDLDVKPHARADVEQHAARACEFLIARQNGRPLIATVPQGGAGGPAKDLDAWMLSAPEAGLHGVLSGLLRRAHRPETWPGLPDPTDAAGSPEPAPVPAPDLGASAPPETSENGRHERTSEPPAAEPSAPESSGSEPPEAEPSGDNGGADAPGGAVEDDNPEAGAFDAYDRWYALLEGHPGADELASRPEPYRPRNGEESAPDGAFALEAELQWAGLFALGAALLFWYYVGASEGWLAGGVGFLPSLPGPLTVAYGLPFALVLGAVAGSVLLLHIRGRRRASRRHLVGPERR